MSRTSLPRFTSDSAPIEGVAFEYAQASPLENPSAWTCIAYPQQWVTAVDSSADEGGFCFDTVMISPQSASASRTFALLSPQSASASRTFGLLSRQHFVPLKAYGEVHLKPAVGRWADLINRPSAGGAGIRIAGERFTGLVHDFVLRCGAPIVVFEDVESAHESTSFAIIDSIRELTESLFPGKAEWEEQSDPDEPSSESVVFTVTVKGEWDEIRPAVLKWHERVEEICPEHLNHFCLRVFPE